MDGYEPGMIDHNLEQQDEDEWNYTVSMDNVNFDDYRCQVKAIKQLRQHLETVDLVLVSSDGASEPVHTFLLAHAAPEFLDMIHDLIDQQKGKHVNNELPMATVCTHHGLELMVPKVTFSVIKGEQLRVILDTMYFVEINLNEMLAWELMVLGDEYHLDFLTEKCLNYAMTTVRWDNCIELLQVGMRFTHPLMKMAYLYIRMHFDILTVLPVGTDVIPFTQLVCLLRDDKLNISCESVAAEAVFSWMDWFTNDNANQLATYFWILFPFIRVNLLDRQVCQRMVEAYVSLDHRFEFKCSEHARKLLKKNNPVFNGKYSTW